MLGDGGEATLDREEMNRIIKFELEYIPRGAKGSNQNKLRFYYNAYRRRGISEGKSREECLEDAIDKLKEDDADFDPVFDEDFFKVRKKGLLQRLISRIKG